MRTAVLIALWAPAFAPAQDNLDIPDDPFAAIAKLPVQSSEPKGVVLVAKAADGTPIPGLSVLYYVGTQPGMPERTSRAFSAALQKRYGYAERALAVPLLVGKRYVTDAKGVVTLPKQREQVRADLVVVRDRQVLPFMLFGRKDEITVRFPPTSPIHVRILNAKGKPVSGVPARFLEKNVVSDEDGRIELSRDPSVPLVVGGRSRTILVDVLTRTSLQQVFDPLRFENSESDPVTFTVPAFATVRVEVRKKSGKIIPTPWHVTLQKQGGRSRVVRRADKGTAVFSHVEAGVPVLASCTIGGLPRRNKEPATAPAAGGTKVVQIVVERIPIVLDFHLIGLDGKPVRNEHVGALLLSKKRIRRDELKTDANGRMIYNVPDAHFEPTEDVEFRIQRVRHAGSLGIFERALASAYLGAYRAPLAAVRQLPPGFKLKLQKPKVVFSGRFVDAKGKPVQGVKLSIHANDGGVKYGGGVGSLVYFHRPMMVTGADGRFAFAELAPPRERIFARIRSYHRVARRLVFDAPALDVELVVGRVSNIHGTVSGIPKDRIPRVQVTAELIGPDAKLQRPRHSGVRRGGAFELRGLIGGTYRISFSRDHGKTVFHAVDGVKVEAGEDCRDKRLQKMDLSRFVRFLKVRVVDADGKPLRRAWVRIGTGPSVDGRGTDENGEAILLIPGVAEVVEVELAGYRKASLSKVRKDLTVKLQRR